MEDRLVCYRYCYICFVIDFTLGDKKNFACIEATRLLYSKKNGSKAVAKRNRIILYHLTLYRGLKVIRILEILFYFSLLIVKYTFLSFIIINTVR